MSSPTYLAARGSFEEFRTAFDGDGGDVTELLMDALTNRDGDARADIAGFLLDRGADASVVAYGQNALSVLIGAHEWVGPRDGGLFARLVDAGADVNYRERRGKLVIHLVAKARVEDESMRAPMWAALFGQPRLDLSKPVNARRGDGPTMLEWSEKFAARRPERHAVLEGYLAAYAEGRG
ncbi:hypothetical protein ACFORJ_01110 [Corynebacterium hansenii]|uniref:Ankyrin repeat domain-containing protein n=1 Tax=Corynebacterium hansenii TaxID=394964 RepID=A0ABV7ZKP9_9CORY|nr:hypothetical protein [Corynebacterium hansenii]WJY99397.1 hypothetical protein CHAN_03870 [Corynebacterium hansenii]